MNTKPTVTVLIPNHNHAQVLGRAIQSVREQTQHPARIVVVDDASTDNSLEVAASFGNDVEVVAHDEKAANWIAALEHVVQNVDTHYLLTLGADDLLYPRCIEALCGVTEAGHPGVVFSDWQRMTYQGVPYDTVCSAAGEGQYIAGPDALRYICSATPHASGIGSMVRADCMRWLYRLRWYDMQSWCDSAGYSAVAINFGAAFTHYVGAGFTYSGMPRLSYHLAQQADGHARNRAACEVRRFFHDAALGEFADQLTEYWVR